MTQPQATRTVTVPDIAAALDRWYNFDEESGQLRTDHAPIISLIPSMVAEAVWGYLPASPDPLREALLEAQELLYDLVAEVGREKIDGSKRVHMGAWLRARRYLDDIHEWPIGTPTPTYTEVESKGYHEGGDKRWMLCNGTISTLGIECPCLCKCHSKEYLP